MHTLPVEAGRYTLTWNPVPSPDGRGQWVPDRASYGVDVPSDGEGNGGTVAYTFQPYPARIDLQVSGPGGGGRRPRICIYPADPSQPPVDPGASIPICP